MSVFPPLSAVPSLEQLQQQFVTVLPRIQRHARFHFRRIACAVRRADYIAEAVALAWHWFVRLMQRGKDARQFVSTLASLDARSVKSGRRLCGQERARDVLSPLAQQRHGFTVCPLPDRTSFRGSILDEALVDNTVSPPDDQASFRIDFPRWRSTFAERDRRIMDDLMLGERTLDISQKYGISPGRVSQKRRQFQQDWRRFHGEVDELVVQPQSD